MTPEQKQRILAVIEHDANGRGMLFTVGEDGTKYYCIVGGLLSAAGESDQELMRGHPRLSQQVLLCKYYGLRRTTVWALMSVNDAHYEQKARRTALRVLVADLPIT